MNWRERWKEAEKVEGGAQGRCFKVKPRDGDKRYFLKELRDGGSSERRRRFFTETMIHQAYDIEYTPSIIETNAQLFADSEAKLYYVADLIEGSRLDKLRSANNLEEPDILGIFRQLLCILRKCHSVDIVHRDIKPENILISNDCVYLVDFGIAYTSLYDSGTIVSQEMGNRFLRLNELAAGSTNKRDVRSDLTLACGIACYLICGNQTSVG